MNKVKNYMMTTDGDGENIFETSFVEFPATEQGFLYFSKQKEKVQQNFQKFDFLRMVSGVWMMPDVKYPRFDETKNEYYTVSFTKDSLKQALLKHLQSGFGETAKVEHQGKSLDGFKTIEYWIIEDESTKSPVFGHTIQDLGYETLPKGTVMKTVFVEDENFFKDEILTGKVTGFSIGGLFGMYELPEEEVENTQFFNLSEELGLSNDSFTFKVDDGTLEIGSKSTFFNGKPINSGVFANDKFEFSIVDGILVDYQTFKVGYEGEIYTDIPEIARQNAKTAFESGGCTTKFATARAGALINGAGITANLLSRTMNVLERLKSFEQDECVKNLFNLFGGEAMLEYAKSKLIIRDDKAENLSGVVEVTIEIDEKEDDKNVLIDEIQDLTLPSDEPQKEDEKADESNPILDELNKMKEMLNSLMVENQSFKQQLEQKDAQLAITEERLNKSPLPKQSESFKSTPNDAYEYRKIGGRMVAVPKLNEHSNNILNKLKFK